MLGIDGDLFHVGIRVHDLRVAMEEIGRSHGVTWAAPRDAPMQIWLPGRGDVSFAFSVTYSCEGPLHMELMQSEPGSPWFAGDGAGLHHFGYWTDDVAAETERLLTEGWTLEMAAAAPEDGYGRFSYVRSPSGVLVEPLNRSARERFEAWWAGGELAAAGSR